MSSQTSNTGVQGSVFFECVYTPSILFSSTLSLNLSLLPYNPLDVTILFTLRLLYSARCFKHSMLHALSFALLHRHIPLALVLLHFACIFFLQSCILSLLSSVSLPTHFCPLIFSICLFKSPLHPTSSSFTKFFISQPIQSSHPPFQPSRWHLITDPYHLPFYISVQWLLYTFISKYLLHTFSSTFPHIRQHALIYSPST